MLTFASEVYMVLYILNQPNTEKYYWYNLLRMTIKMAMWLKLRAESVYFVDKVFQVPPDSKSVFISAVSGSFRWERGMLGWGMWWRLDRVRAVVGAEDGGLMRVREVVVLAEQCMVTPWLYGCVSFPSEGRLGWVSAGSERWSNGWS